MSFKINMRTEGLDLVTARLALRQARAAKLPREFLPKAAKIVKEKQIELAPKDTGVMARSIHIVYKGSTAHIGPRYGGRRKDPMVPVYIEYGFRKDGSFIAPNPFVRQSREQSLAQIIALARVMTDIAISKL